MGIVNVTPDSFSDGGLYGQAQQAIEHCQRLVDEGADILDIGGESSRPGAKSLDADEEWARVSPVLKFAVGLGVPISVDTCKPEVMRLALAAGADILNDIRAFQEVGAMQVLMANPKAGLCLMHMRGEPQTMQTLTEYGDLVAEVMHFLADRVAALQSAGVSIQRLVLDPGYGFAKTTEQNFALLARQSELLALGYPLLTGWSRKRALGDATGRPVDQRLPGSLAAALASAAQGARILRVHDVAATTDALKVWQLAGASLGPLGPF